MKGKKYCTLKEAAHYLGVSIRSVYRRRNEGALKAYKPNGRVYFKIEDLDRYIENEGNNDEKTG